MSETIGLPMVMDTLRCEAYVIRDAAMRASEQMTLCYDAVKAAHARIKELEDQLEAALARSLPESEVSKILLRCARESFTSEELELVYGLGDKLADYIERCREGDRLHLDGGIRSGMAHMIRETALPLYSVRAREELVSAKAPLHRSKQT